MTRHQRVIDALNHKDTDMVPFHFDLTQQAFEKISRHLGSYAFIKKSGIHLHYFQYWGWPTETEKGSELFLDDFGVTWNRSGVDKDIGIIEKPVVYKPDLSLMPEPVLDEKKLRRQIEETIASKEDKFVFAGIGFSMFERFWSYCGMENALIYMITEPEFTHAILDEICEFNLRVIDIFNEYPLDGIYFGDDWGQQRGLIMGPKLWREFIKPRMAEMYARAKKNNKYIFQHSCGDILEIFPDLIEIGLDCYQTFQPEIYDIEAVKKEYGNDLAFWGGISTQKLLPYAAPEKVKEETKRIMDIMSEGGGYIAAPTHAIPFDVPVENILAMLEVFENQNK